MPTRVLVAPTALRLSALLVLGALASPGAAGGRAAQGAESAEARGKRVIEQAVVAAGGLPALRSIRDVTTRGTVKLITPMGETGGTTVAEVVYPDKTRSSLSLPMGIMVQGYDGSTGWMKMGGQVMDLPPVMLPEMRRGIVTAAGVDLLRLAAVGEARVEALDVVEIEGRKADAVSWKQGEVEMRVYFDAETHLLAKIAYRSNSPDGASEVEILTSDFREVGGLKVPFTVVGVQNGRQFIEQRFSEVTFNSGLAPTGFGKPAP